MLRSTERPGPAPAVEPFVLARREDVALRLFVFPHAGGGPQTFRTWPAGLPDDVETVSYTLPGRGRRQDEPPYQDWPSLVADLVRWVELHDDGAPFALFGHSFGALLAFDVCRELIRADGRRPSALLLSAHRAPHLPPDTVKHSLPEDVFTGHVRDWGLVPEDLLADEEVLRLLLPPLRADLRLDETYPCRTGDGTGVRLDVPCAVYGGTADPTVDAAELHAWRAHFTDDTPFDVELLPGGHFYLRDSEAALLAGVTRRLDRVRAAAGPSVALTPRAYPAPDRSLWARFRDRAAEHPDAPALIDGDRRWTYGRLADDTAAFAADLTALGVAKGDVVGLFLPHSAEYCLALLGCFGLGAPACLLEKNWPASLLARFLDSARVRTVVTTPELAGLLPPAYRAPERLLVLDGERRPGGRCPDDRCPDDRCPDGRCPGGRCPDDRCPDDRCPDGRCPGGRCPDAVAPPALPDVAPSDTALISMTSGTSGTPKAVLNSHLGCLYCFDARQELYPYEETSRDGLNVFFAWECLRPLLHGRPAVIVPDDHIVDPVRLVDTLRRQRITRIVVPPSLFESVLDHPTTGPRLAAELAHMEIVFLMGEVVPARVVEKAVALLPPHVRLVNAYSTWESLDVSYADLLPRPPAAGTARTPAFAPVGRLLDGTAAVLLDDRGEPVPRGGVGELLVAGPGVADGYLDDPAKTAERFVPCPPALAGTSFTEATFYRTGDRARFLPDGGLEVLGRAGDVVKLRGFKVSLRAVESVLEDQPDVSRVIVRPVPDERTGQPAALVAYVLGERGRPSDTVLARTRRKAARDLPEYARPRHVLALDALPLSGGGSRKLDLAALPAPPGEPGSATAGEALTTTEQRVARAWSEVLGVRSAGPDDDFFALGGDSLAAARLSGLLAERYGVSLPVVDVFQYPVLRDLAAHCAGGRREREPAPEPRRRTPRPPTTRLAIVGMAGRFPGAPDLDAFWDNLRHGTDSLTTFTPEYLRRKGVPEDVVTHPRWVPAAQLVDDADKFDAEFWGIGRREAVTMDPQHRVFVETAWHALEQAGYARRNNPYRRRTGVFAACGIDGYLVHHLKGGGLTQPLDPAGLFLTEIGNEKDYIATRVAYLLDLGGPAVTVTSACSSALVAVAQAAQSIVSGQCDMAVAGASALTFPNFGYRYEEGLVGSADGRVRPFDADASGTLFGDAVGAVVLKRLDDALADGDHVWAVLTGFGVSNDGRMKAGYTAPSARAQTQCVSDALTMAGIDSGRLSYVECHATATHVGDAIELKGLHDAFERHRDDERPPRTGGCALGSVKGNIGHANCAAGITGLIKTVLCLHHRELVPTVHHDTLNPKLVDLVDCDGSPFTVRRTHGPWTVADPDTQLPRRAGVSSFGIGGTNAHVILEEAPRPAPDEEPEPAAPGTPHLLTVSARSASALRRNADALARHVEGLPDGELAPAVRALHLTRESHPLRATAVITEGAADGLRRLSAEPPATARRGRAATVAFCFSGQGSQTAGMARGLYRGHADGGRFRRHFDAACASLARHLPEDPAALVLGADDTSVTRPVTTQCGLFAVEYALATTLTELGVRPVAVAGHSIGEYAAAALTGLLTLDEAAELVAVRARATEELLPGEPGGMLGVVGDEERLARWLEGRTGLWPAAENAPGRVVLSGTPDALRQAREELPALGLTCRPLPVSHPFHSPLMAPVAARLDAAAAGLPARVPAVPTASNLTGTWLDAGHRPDTYWGAHLTSTVRWRDAVGTLLRWEPDLVLEIGPGRVLTTLTHKCLDARAEPGPVPLATMPYAADPGRDDGTAFLEALGDLWRHGADVDLAALHEGERPRHRVLPAYGFDRVSHWTDPDASPYVDGTPEPEPAQDGPLVRFAAKPDARLRLYCLPYAGGGADAFRSWACTAPPWLDVVAVELPGRAGDTAQPLPDDAFLARLADAVRADAGPAPVAFCGLSLGASLVVDLLGGPLADWARDGRVTAVSVVGRAPLAPDAPADAAPPESYLMAPDELRDDPRWRREVLPLLQADLALDARAERRAAGRRETGGAPLDCPLQVQAGTDDPSFPAAAAVGWAAYTTSPIVETQLHEGAHDFMLRHRADVLTRLTAFLDRLLPHDTPGTSRLHEVRWVPLPRPAPTGAALAAPGPAPEAAVGGMAPAVPSARSARDGQSPRTGLAEGGSAEGGPAGLPVDAVGAARTELDAGWAAEAVRPGGSSPAGVAAQTAADRPAGPPRPPRPPVEPGAIPWTVLDADGPAAAARFLRAALVGAEAEAALVCRAGEEDDAARHCAELRDVLLSLADAGARGRLTVVLPARAASGLAAGMTRAFALEEPGLAVRRIHVHAWPDDTSSWPDGLLRRARAHLEETDLLHRRGHLLGRRLVPLDLPELPPGTLGAADGSYLLTGGTGGLGRAVADWLIHHQRVAPERVVVTGRTDPGDLRPGVRFLAADLARPFDAAALAARTGPLAGVLHLAGALDDGILRNLDPSRFPAVLAPKLALAPLTELARHAGAPWIVAFSSTSGLLGAPGQANYAAANAWMDAHATWRTPGGGPAVVSVGWGTWGDTGMAARDAKALEGARAAAETPLSTGTGLALLGKAVAALLSGDTGPRHLAACEVDWARSPWAGTPLVRGLLPTEPPEPAAPDPARPSDTGPRPEDEDGVRAFLSGYVHRWDASERLADLGLDSLDFARMRGDFARRFGKDVPLADIARPDQRLGELHAYLSQR
ncbi:type I polyketide synthase [Streptomyces mobaraensis NBRC 13819 = DSM 40847]|uniref:type I polyketide synthase n=1 Tax=Streptomyces mobaraensis TaxID=35621 RepID=UPI001B30B7F5|nr:type I polyketide synthase [Streptomyces mobaraensis]QTT77108.1 type I polyketide synthase [Streptomyces mobaraensis NBRC 13819 = DSM 40847]